MNNTSLQRIINEYLKQCGEDGLAEHITSVLDQEQNIKRKMKRVIEEQKQETEIYEKIMEALELEIGTIQIECPHFENEFSPDPAGAGDSSHECLWCGKRW